MFESIQAFIARIKEARANERSDEGYAWAMVSYYRHNKSLDELEQFIETARACGTYNEFDSGVESAIRQIELRDEFEAVYVRVCKQAEGSHETFYDVETESGYSIRTGSKQQGSCRLIGPLYRKIKH